MFNNSLYEALCKIVAAKTELLRAYAADLHEIDKKVLSQSYAGDQFVWVGRNHGTDMARVGSSKIEQGLACYSAKSNPDFIYLLTVTEDGGYGHLKHIDVARATDILDGKREVVCQHTERGNGVLVANGKVLADVQLTMSREKSGVVTATVALNESARDITPRMDRDINDALQDYAVSQAGSLFVRLVVEFAPELRAA